MKKAFLNIIFILTSAICYGQANKSGIDIKYLHSEDGKSWKRMIRDDGAKIAASLEDDIFIFYTDGTFKYDHSGTTTQALSNSKTKKWVYNNETNVLTLEFYLPNGTVRTYKAEFTFLDEGRAVMNLSENGTEPTIVVWITN